MTRESIQNHIESYTAKSFEEINNGHIDLVVRRELLIGQVFRALFIKLLILLRQRAVLTQEEIDGISSEAFDALIWQKEKVEERVQARLAEIDAEIKELTAKLKELDDNQKQN